MNLNPNKELGDYGLLFKAQYSGHDGCERKLKCRHVLESGGEAIPSFLGQSYSGYNVPKDTDKRALIYHG